MIHLVLACGILAIAPGCGLSHWMHNGFNVGPDYTPPEAMVSDNWIDSDDPELVTQPPQCPEWWSVFEDPVLNALVDEAHQQNLTLRESGLRIMQARAQRAIAAGNLMPQTQSLDGGFTRTQLGTVSQPYLLPATDFKRNFDSWALSGNLSWELDIWGRFREALASADAGLEASIHDYDAILVSLIAEVVTTYIDIRTLEQRLDYARENLRTQEGSLGLAKARLEEGKTDATSVHLSKSNVENTRAFVISIEIELRKARNRLCTLLGSPTLKLDDMPGEHGVIPKAPSAVVVGIPADLLRRRPDVRAAERQVAAQSAQIGVAISDLYPRIAVTGQISLGSEKFSDVFTPQALGGSVGPSFEWNLLNYGRIVNNIWLQDARFAELIANYQQTILEANQEVEDSLVTFLKTQDRVKSLAATVQETKAALDLELIGFAEGEKDYTGVFILQANLLQKQDQLAQAQGDVASSLVGTYKALGGGWEIRCPINSSSTAVEGGGAMENIPTPKAMPLAPDENLVPPVEVDMEELSTKIIPRCIVEKARGTYAGNHVIQGPTV